MALLQFVAADPFAHERDGEGEDVVLDEDDIVPIQFEQGVLFGGVEVADM